MATPNRGARCRPAIFCVLPAAVILVVLLRYLIGMTGLMEEPAGTSQPKVVRWGDHSGVEQERESLGHKGGFPGVPALLKASEMRYKGKASRGILVVGKRRQLVNAYVNLKILREKLNCTLPVIVVYHGPVEAPRPELRQALLSLPDVTVVDAAEMTLPPELALPPEERGQNMGFFTKIYALAFVGPFTEVLLLDSDNLPLMNPNELFETKHYQDNGNLFWPDWWRHYGTMLTVKPELYTRFGLPVPWSPHLDGGKFRCSESGQVLLDRARHFDVLLTLWWLSKQREAIDKLTHGDKDLYRLAFALANKTTTYQQVEFPARNAVSQGHNQLNFMGMVQLHPENARPVFHHRTGPSKYFPHNSETLQKLEAARVAYLSCSLTHDDAYRVVGRWHWPMQEVDVSAWDTKKCAYTAAKDAQWAYRDVPELWCADMGAGGAFVIPMYSLDKFGLGGQVMNDSHNLLMNLVKDKPDLFKRPVR